MTIDQQTLKDLEFPTICTWLQEYAMGPTANSRLGTLSPLPRKEDIRAELGKVDELRKIRTEGESFPGLSFEELTDEIRLLPIHRASISLEGFLRIYDASRTVNALLHFFDKRESDYPLLAGTLANAYFTEEIIQAIEAVFDRHGKVRDDASEALFEIRSKIKVVRNQINRNFDREMRRLMRDNMLGDTHETFINDRRVLTVLSNYKRKVSGTVLGSSKTGNLTYIEPEVNIPLNNELELLFDDERKEIFRILQVLKKQLCVHLALIEAYQEILTSFDFIQAKTRLCMELQCQLPSLNEEMETELIEAYHPILWKSNQLAGKKTFPQHVKMDKFSRMLVISGPNAGGKSITLKSVGLLQLMLQSGLLVPVHPNSRMCLYDNILSDIGDNQSIANELSTYSYRLKRMHTFLEIANRKTLLLLDEFGTGSDPELGGALAEVIFEALYNKKSFAVITTHYTNIKLKADQLKNAVNGSMLFNTETLEPTYTFSMGQPGSSFTFEVAKINGIPDELIEEAKNRIDNRKVNMDRLLNELQKEKNYLARLNKEHIVAQELAAEALEEFREKRTQYEEKLRLYRENSEQQQSLIQRGKKLGQFIDRYNIHTRKKALNEQLLEEVRKYLAVEKSKTEAAKEAEKKAKKPPVKKVIKKARPNEPDEYQRDRIKVGSRVKLITTRQIGTVEEINDKSLTVSFGFARMKVELQKLMWVQDP